MPRPKTPYAKAFALGAVEKHRERYKPLPPTNLPNLGPLGDPPEWLKPGQVEFWNEIAADIPWLTFSHRGIAAIASIAADKWRASEGTNIKAGNLLRLCLQSMGATPATEHLAGR